MLWQVNGTKSPIGPLSLRKTSTQARLELATYRLGGKAPGFPSNRGDFG
jgi:hypothetical protein